MTDHSEVCPLCGKEQGIFKQKKLKGKKLLITESLTVYRMKLLDEARQKYGVRNIWTYDGRVMYKKTMKFLYTKNKWH